MRDYYLRCCETCHVCDGKGGISDVEKKGFLVCPECKGAGKINKEVNLVDALNDFFVKKHRRGF